MSQEKSNGTTQAQNSVASSVLLGEKLIFITNCLTCVVCVIGLAAYKSISARVSKLETIVLSDPNIRLQKQSASIVQPQKSTKAGDAALKAGQPILSTVVVPESPI